MGRTPSVDEGRDWDDVSTEQETPKIDSKLPEARGETWNRLLLTALGRNEPCQHLDLTLLTPRTLRGQISVVQAIRLVVLCYRKLCQP